MIKGWICRSKNSDTICISDGCKPPEKNFKRKKTGWYWHIPGWFHTMKIQTFKKHFGFSIKSGTHEKINILISKRK